MWCHQTYIQNAFNALLSVSTTNPSPDGSEPEPERRTGEANPLWRFFSGTKIVVYSRNSSGK